MSELINKSDNRATIRWKLLTGASVFALTAQIWGATPTKAEDANGPSVWLELGGQLSRLQDGEESFSPPIMEARPAMFAPSQNFEHPPLFSIDETAGLSFRPAESDWVFSASLRYGRSANHRSVQQQTEPALFHLYFNYFGYPINFTAYPSAAKFANTDLRISERHFILDFQAGKDVGLGLFKSESSSSTVSLGVRFAQFRSKSNIALKSGPDWHFVYRYYPTLITYFNATSSKNAVGQAFHSNMAELQASRSFRGVGPSISWTASAPFAGNPQSGELMVDWGLNAALLFGKQRTTVHHQSTTSFRSTYAFHAGLVPGTPNTDSVARSRTVTVPNVGGFAGISWNYDNAKVSFGYKVDWFFNAIDGGIDVAKKEDRGFYGPYASISIGLGD